MLQFFLDLCLLLWDEQFLVSIILFADGIQALEGSLALAFLLEADGFLLLFDDPACDLFFADFGVFSIGALPRIRFQIEHGVVGTKLLDQSGSLIAVQKAIAVAIHAAYELANFVLLGKIDLDLPLCGFRLLFDFLLIIGVFLRCLNNRLNYRLWFFFDFFDDSGLRLDDGFRFGDRDRSWLWFLDGLRLYKDFL